MKSKIFRIIGAWMLALALLAGCAGSRAEEGTSSASVTDRINAYLSAQAAGQDALWIRAILESGARNVTWDGEKAVFFLRGYELDLKGLGAYAKAADKAAWRQAAAEQLSAWGLQAELQFGADGNVTARSGAALMRLVRAAGRAAKANLGKKDWTQAVTDMLFPQPVQAKKVDAASLMTADSAGNIYIAEKEITSR